MNTPTKPKKTKTDPASFSWDEKGNCVEGNCITIQAGTHGFVLLFTALRPDGEGWSYGAIVSDGAPDPLMNHPCMAQGLAETTEAEAVESAASLVTFNRDLPKELIDCVDNYFKPALGLAITEPVLPGTASEWREDGECLTPEIIKVALKGAFEVEIYLGVTEAGHWFAGQYCRIEEEEVSTSCTRNGEAFADRKSAFRWVLNAALEFYTVTRKPVRGLKGATTAISVLLEALDEACAPVVAPVNARAPVYVTSYAATAVAKIQRNPENNRKHFDAVALRELADSIRAEGLHQPILIRRLLDGEIPTGELSLGDASAPEFELIAGERRWRAMAIAGRDTIDAKIYEGLVRSKMKAIALIENLQREGLNCMEEAEGYTDLMKDEGLSTEACADRVGKNRSTVAKFVRLLQLPDLVRDQLREGIFSPSHGHALARFAEWPDHLRVIAEEALEARASSKVLEKGVPFVSALIKAELAVVIDQFAAVKLPPKFKGLPQYISRGDGDWVCFDPEHWRTYLEEKAEKQRLKEEADAKEKQLAEADLAKKKRKQLRLADLDRDSYRRFEGDSADLLALVPESSKRDAKDWDKSDTVIVTDVELAERLKKALQRATKKNRKGIAIEIEGHVLKGLKKLKTVGSREIAWLVFMRTDLREQRITMSLTAEAVDRSAEAFGSPSALPDSVLEIGDRNVSGEAFAAHEQKRLHELNTCSGAELVRALIAERLPSALVDMIEAGPDSLGARYLRWWLNTDTLWLLEESEEGRAELIAEVKDSGWYERAIAGEEEEEG